MSDELFIVNGIDRFKSEKEKRERYKERYKHLIRKRNEDSLELLEKFKSLTNEKSINILNPEKKLEPQKKEFYDFIINERIRKKLEYRLMVEVKEYDYFLFPECHPRWVYRNMVMFKTNINNLESSMIQFIRDRKSEEFFQYLQFKENISIYKKLDLKAEDINGFIKSFNFKDLDLSRIIFESSDHKEFIDQMDILIGVNDYYLSIKGSPTDLDFLISAKRYLSELGEI